MPPPSMTPLFLPLLWRWFSHFCISPPNPNPEICLQNTENEALNQLLVDFCGPSSQHAEVCFKYQSPFPPTHQPFTVIHENDDSLHTDLQAPSREVQRRMNLNSWTMKSKLVMKAWNLVALTYFLFCFLASLWFGFQPQFGFGSYNRIYTSTTSFLTLYTFL